MSKPPVIVIFGITGDLSKRKLLPALYHLMAHDLLDANTKIIGTSRKAVDTKALLGTVELCVLEKRNVCDPVGLAKIEKALQIVQLDPTESQDYAALAQTLDELDNGDKRDRLFYMAIPPEAYGGVIAELGRHGLNDDRTRLLVEKPFGSDVSSAKALVKLSMQHFAESQLYRIDHYLAKETVQNLLTFRMHNPIFTSLWSGEHIERIRIIASETLGVENRIDFYEQTGALRDVIQGHLLQLLAIIMMDQPASSSSMNIHDGKLAFLASIADATPDTAVRSQYEGYTDDVNKPSSFVETYARVTLTSQLARWQDTEIVLETGKAMKHKITEIIVQFKQSHERRKNQLRFRLQPDEGISLDLVVKKPGFVEEMQHTQLDFSYANEFGTESSSPDAYERVIMDAIAGDHSLFASSDEVLESWRIVQPLIDAWTASGEGLTSYPKGVESV